MNFKNIFYPTYNLIDKTDKSILSYSFLFTLVIGMLAYGFMFTNGFYSHDSLTAIFPILDNNWQISLGRFIQPIFRSIFIGNLNTFWYQGILGLLFLSLSSYFIYKLLDLKSKIHLFFISSVLTLNISSTLLVATYLQWFCIYALSQLFAIIAAYLLFKSKKYWLFSSVFLIFSIGLYQLYLSSFLVLVIIKLLQILTIQSQNSKDIFFDIAKKSILILITSMVFYACALYLTTTFHGIKLASSYNSIDNALTLKNKDLRLLFNVYLQPLNFLSNPTPFWNTTLIFLNFILYTTSIFLTLILSRGFTKLLSLFLILLLPLAANITTLLSGGMVHNLMLSPLFYCFFIFCILQNVCTTQSVLYENFYGYILQTNRLFFLLFVVIFSFNSIKFSNSIIEKKQLESIQTFVNVTSFLNRLNSIPDYKSGETKVVIVAPESHIFDGSIFNNFKNNVKSFYQFTGNHSPSAATYELTINYYFNILLNQNVNLFRIIPLESFDHKDKFKINNYFYLNNLLYIKVK